MNRRQFLVLLSIGATAVFLVPQIVHAAVCPLPVKNGLIFHWPCAACGSELNGENLKAAVGFNRVLPEDEVAEIYEYLSVSNI